MIVRHWMTTKVVTINKGASIQEALALMKKGSIRHLPVVDAENHLIGWVTDADLRGVLIASMLEELNLEDVMIRKPYAANPDMPLEDAAHVILERRIGGLPVLEDGKLVGIITVVDILSAFITMMGLLPYSSRVDVKGASDKSVLSAIVGVLERHDVEVISIYHQPKAAGQENVYSIRLKKCDLAPILANLKEKGLEIVSSNL